MVDGEGAPGLEAWVIRALPLFSLYSCVRAANIRALYLGVSLSAFK